MNHVSEHYQIIWQLYKASHEVRPHIQTLRLLGDQVDGPYNYISHSIKAINLSTSHKDS